MFCKYTIQKLFSCGALALAISMTSCNTDDDDTSVSSTAEDYAFFVAATGESADYIISTDSVDGGSVSIVGNGIELDDSGYKWIFKDDASLAIGLIYNQGDPGVGLAYYLDTAGLQSYGTFQITSRFTTYGFYGDKALTMVGGQTPVDADGSSLTDDNGDERTDGVTINVIDTENGSLSLTETTITTLGLTSSGQQATFSGVVDFGDGTFLTGMVVSQGTDESGEGGASTGTVVYPDSCWVAAINEDFEVERIYRSDKISYASGRYRSQYYSQIAKDDDGNAYVFSGSYDDGTSLPCGAIRINSGATDFDDDYYFDIESLSGGYHFREVWHITEDYFLLAFYDDVTPSASGTAYKLGIVKMEDQTFNWVAGEYPDTDNISDLGETPMAYDGKIYVPVTETGSYPVIYEIDPTTFTATAGLSVTATTANGVGYLEVQE